MRTTRMLASAFLFGMGLAGCDQLRSFGPDTSHGAIAACEQATLKTLVSPSSYRRVWTSYNDREPLNDDERKRYADRNKCTAAKEQAGECQRTDPEKFADAYAAKMIEDIERKLRLGLPLSDIERDIEGARRNKRATDAANPQAVNTGFVTLEYDSANSFGAQLRAFGICRFGPLGSDGKFEEGDIFQMGPVSREDGEMAKKVASTTAS